MRLAVLVALFALIAAPATVVAWGPIGHATVASIAQSLLNNQATALVNRLLDGQTMASVASWADDVRHESQWAWSAPLHYIDTPDQLCSYSFTRDCQDHGQPGFCVAGAIANFSTQIVNSVKNISHEPVFYPKLGVIVTAADALKFVIHFVGDIHQPLHVGFTSDEGGNTIKITFYGESEVLHAIWDTNIIERIISVYYNNNQTAWESDLQTRVSPGGSWYSQAQQWGKCNDGTSQSCITPIAVESITAACQYSYQCKASSSSPCASEGVITNPNLADPYFNASYPVINMRIAQGGVRLAAFLNGLASIAETKPVNI